MQPTVPKPLTEDERLERLRLAGAKVKSIRIEQRSAAAPAPNVAAPGAALSPAEEAALAMADFRASLVGAVLNKVDVKRHRLYDYDSY